MGWRRVGGVLLLGAAMAMGGCALVEPDRDGGASEELERARDRWAAQGSRDYEITVQRLCFCLPDYTAPVVVTVRGRAVSGRRYADGRDLAVPAEDARFWPGVEGLFEVVEDAIERDAHSIEVDYDAQRGFPTRVRIDYDEMMADEEVEYTAGSYRAL